MEIAIALGGFIAGLVVALLLASRWRRPAPPEEYSPDFDVSRRVIELMEPGAVVVDGADNVILANAAALGLGVIRGGELAVPHLMRLVVAVRRAGERREDVQLSGELVGMGPRTLGVHAVRLDADGVVAILLQDVTESRRVEEVRRDFIANVSHELKTPVGALSLLAEAVHDAADDPQAVRRFSARMLHEGRRLNRLVREVIDLSRLQGGDPLPILKPVAVRVVVAEAIDRARLAADAREITLACTGDRHEVVLAAEGQLVTALTNLLANAVAYSSPGTTVTVDTSARSGFAEIAVIDQGDGIPGTDQARIFERFYRVDPARASATGGNGLGLAIVKHIASNHGGVVRVTSAVGAGSTFTLRIPLAPESAPVPRIQTQEVR